MQVWISLPAFVIKLTLYPNSLAHLKGDWHEFEAKTRRRRERAAAKEREAQAVKKDGSSTGSIGPSTEPRQR